MGIKSKAGGSRHAVWLLIGVYFLAQISGFSLADGYRADVPSAALVFERVHTHNCCLLELF